MKSLYIVGIDVGGTNTDATLIHDGQVIGMAKAPTNHHALFESTSEVLQKILDYYPGKGIIQLQLSTTLSTNAIVEGTGTPTALVAVPGPGVNLDTLELGFPVYSVPGYVDHRGREVASLDRTAVLGAAFAAKRNGAQALAAAGKFSHRNPGQEQEIASIIQDGGPQFEHITLGHRLSGKANFPRRMVTAYLNSSVAQHQARFVEMIEELRSSHTGKVIENVLILKADGGTMTLADSLERPVETILSGPAASIMGAQALSKYVDENIVVIDIGGTTTDIAVIVNGEPVFERNGAVISGYRTLVPALLTQSVGLGGDSEIHGQTAHDGSVQFTLGPRRAGRAAALGGEALTPTDAAAALGLADVGDRERSIQALKKFGAKFHLDEKTVAQRILEAFTRQLKEAVEELYYSLENVPLYTVSEILAPPEIRPSAIVGLGAPAEVFIPLVAETLDLPYEVLPYSEGANAVGAGAAQPTAAITFHADTELAVMTIPEMGLQEKIERSLLFDRKRAKQEALHHAAHYARELGLPNPEDVQVVEEESFNVVRGFYTAGQIHTIRAQLRPRVRRIK